MNKKQYLLNEKLRQFSLEHGGYKIKWNDWDQKKYSLLARYISKDIIIRDTRELREVGSIYFISENIAKKALDIFKEELYEVYGLK